MTMRAGGFRLRKYYLDCVGADGSVCIGYVARLRWGPLSVRYAALLECDAAGNRRERHSFARVPEPVSSGDGVAWECEALGVRGCWRDATPGYEVTLLDGAAGAAWSGRAASGRLRSDAASPLRRAGMVRWHVLAPRARASLDGPGVRVRGWGYVERLELTIEPWRLPFDTLHWGHFHSESDALVWIGWDGDIRLRHIRHNQELLEDGCFSERVLRFEPGRVLQLSGTRTLHDGPVIAAVARLPRVLQRVPPSFLAAREVKWLSQARLSSGTRPSASGWALHEQVRFH